MATIKLTGFNTATARQSVAGDGDTVDLDGSLTIGNNDTDTIIVNAEFDSDLVPDDDGSYDLGSASKKWRYGYFEQINAKQRHVKSAKYRSTTNDIQYIRWDSTGANTTPGVNNKFIAPTDGILLSVAVRATSTPNGTNISFHKSSNGTTNLNTTPVETVSVDMASSNTTYEVTLSSSSFNRGEILGVSIDPSSTPNDVNVTTVWLFDWNS
jgi:hypothetical protein